MSFKKYKPVRFPLDAYNNFLEKQRKMEQTAQQLLGREIRIPMTKIIRMASKTPITLPDEMLVRMSRRKKNVK